MRFTRTPLFGLVLPLCFALQGLIQPRQAPVRIPFVGCNSDGQTGPQDLPKGHSQAATIPDEIAARVALYKGPFGRAVLAPRGWHCFETYGSSGETLYVAPQPLSSSMFFAESFHGLIGPYVLMTDSYGGTSGRFAVAEAIARVFPAHKDFVASVTEEGIRDTPFPSGPYAHDVPTYKSNELVEFQTPAHYRGLGGGMSELPTSGFAELSGPDTDLTKVVVRLTPAFANLADYIVEQAESSKPN